MEKIFKIPACPPAVLGVIAGVSAFSLAAALTAEIAFGLEPCILCIYQRIPFSIALILSLLYFGLYKINKKKGHGLAAYVIGLCGLAFLANSVIAFYHSGVERHWWKSFIETCAAPNLGSDPQTMLENILSAPAARCDEIPWADPILGLSMANYNVALCLGLFGFCALALVMQRRVRSAAQAHRSPDRSGK